MNKNHALMEIQTRDTWDNGTNNEGEDDVLMNYSGA